jgi:hypothetical protein
MGVVSKLESWRIGRRDILRDKRLRTIAENLADAEEDFYSLVSDVRAVLLDAPRSALPPIGVRPQTPANAS